MISLIKRIIKGCLRPFATPLLSRIRIIVREEITKALAQSEPVTTDASRGIEDLRAAPIVNESKTIIKSFEQLDDFVLKNQKHDFGGLSPREFLHSHKIDYKSFVELFGTPHPEGDPFSDEYVNWEMSFFKFLHGNDYSPDLEGISETQYEQSYMGRHLSYGWAVDKRIDRMRIYADFLEKIKPNPEMSVLEMGFGWGNMVELLGRCG